MTCISSIACWIARNSSWVPAKRHAKWRSSVKREEHTNQQEPQPNGPQTQANKPESSDVQDMKPPTGIDMRPMPPLATRLRKRPGWIVFGVLLVVSIVVCYSLY